MQEAVENPTQIQSQREGAADWVIPFMCVKICENANVPLTFEECPKCPWRDRVEPNSRQIHRSEQGNIANTSSCRASKLEINQSGYSMKTPTAAV